jgi:hypothetical protein
MEEDAPFDTAEHEQRTNTIDEPLKPASRQHLDSSALVIYPDSA